jgi:hypothetical protein
LLALRASDTVIGGVTVVAAVERGGRRKEFKLIGRLKNIKS